MNAENLRQVASVQLGQMNFGQQFPALFAHTDYLIKKVSIVTRSPVTSDDNGLVLQLLNAATGVVLAQLKAGPSGQGGITQFQGKFFAVSITDEHGAPALAGSTLVLQQVQQSTIIDLTGAMVYIEYVRNKNN